MSRRKVEAIVRQCMTGCKILVFFPFLFPPFFVKPVKDCPLFLQESLVMIGPRVKKEVDRQCTELEL